MNAAPAQDFADRIKIRAAAYKAAHEDPNSPFNLHLARIEANQPEQSTFLDLPALRVPGSAYIAVAENGRKNAAVWTVITEDRGKGIVCYLRKNEVNAWLVRMALAEQDGDA